MNSVMPRHPHAYTLDLLKLAIRHLPPDFSDMERRLYENKLAEFRQNPDMPYDEIHAVIVELGRSSWPFRRAYEEMYSRYGRSSEEAHLLENLDKGPREKYEKFIHEGGKINYILEARRAEDLHKPSPFTRYFTPEEKFSIGQALVSARDQAREEIFALIADQKHDEYTALIEDNLKQQEIIVSLLDQLAALAEVSDKWRSEIEQQLRTFREGWSVVERSVTLEEVSAALDYWRGTMESFLKTA